MRFRVSGFGFRISGFGFRVSGLDFWVSGSDFGVQDKRIRKHPSTACGSMLSASAPNKPYPLHPTPTERYTQSRKQKRQIGGRGVRFRGWRKKIPNSYTPNPQQGVRVKAESSGGRASGTRAQRAAACRAPRQTPPPTLPAQHSKFNTQHSTLNTQHSTLSNQHSTLNTLPATYDPRYKGTSS